VTATGVGLSSTVGTAAAQYEGWFDDVDNYEGTVDYRGQTEVTVTVGAGENGLLFDPPAILVDPGTTVTWEWSGEGGTHNVVAENEAYESELVGEEGHTFEHTFETEDVFRYFCEPHRAVGMKGAVAVGDIDDDLIDPDPGGGQPLTGADMLIVAASLGLAGLLVLAVLAQTRDTGE
jgi:halocyanin-like protein